MSKNKRATEINKDKQSENEISKCNCECCKDCDCQECKSCKRLEEELEKEKQLKLMALADLINYRKRVDKEREEMHTQANRRILLHIIDVVDDLNRAMENQKQDDVISMLLNKLGSILKDYSLEEIQCNKGDVFNPEIMEAITAVNAKNENEKNKVMDVISKGYRNSTNGQVFKSVKVIIAR